MSEVNQAARSLLRPSNFRKLLIWLKVPLRHADDVSQNGFVRFYKKLPRIALSAEVLPLLKRFVVFEALNFRRLASSRREVLNPFDALDLDLDALGLGDGRQGPEDHAIAREHCEKVLGWIEQLDDGLKAVLVAHVRDGMSLADIAKAQGITEKAAEHRLASARSVLQALMERWQAEPRRHGQRVARLLPLPLWEFDELTWFKERLGVVIRTLGSGAQGALLGGLLIVGHAADRSPSRHALHHLPPMGFVAVVSVGPRTEQVETPGASGMFESTRAMRSPSSGAKATPGTAANATHDPEETLIMRASSLIETGSPEAILEASELLEEHFEKYRAGRLAARREALRRQIR